LVFALIIGIGAMGSVYSFQASDWRHRWQELSKFFHPQNRRLSVAVLSGAIASTMSYMAVAIWLYSDNGWIASAIILQGFGTLLTLALLVWLATSLYGNRDEGECDRLISQLTDIDPLKRLIAIRQLTKLVERSNFDREEEKNITEYLQLLLTQEQDKIVREAAFDGLQVLDRLEINSSVNNLPLQPLVIKNKTKIST
jgi:hypothetical protein